MDTLSQSHSESSSEVETVLTEGVRGYRRDGRKVYEREFRKRVAAECRDSGKSLASIALHYGINANLVRRWMDQFAPKSQAMLPVSLSTLPVAAPVVQHRQGEKPNPSLRIEINGVLVALSGCIEPDTVEAVVRALAPR